MLNLQMNLAEELISSGVRVLHWNSPFYERVKLICKACEALKIECIPNFGNPVNAKLFCRIFLACRNSSGITSRVGRGVRLFDDNFDDLTHHFPSFQAGICASGLATCSVR